MKRRAYALLCIGFGRLSQHLPLLVCQAIGHILGRIAFTVVPRVRRVALGNVDRAYGDALSASDKRRIAIGAAENACIVAAEFPYIARIDRSFIDRHIRVTGYENLDMTRGGVLISGHLGNWEWLGPVIQCLHGRLAEVVRPLDDPWLDAFVNGIRTSNGVTTIPKAHAGREIIHRLREGYLVGILVDQSPAENGVPVRFFGRPCWATIAPVMAAFRAHVPVYPFSLTRDAEGQFAMEIGPPIEMTRSGDLLGDLATNSQRCQDAIEERVRAHPEQWLWLHRRWKTRPRLEEEWQHRRDRSGAKAEG